MLVICRLLTGRQHNVFLPAQGIVSCLLTLRLLNLAQPILCFYYFFKPALLPLQRSTLAVPPLPKSCLLYGVAPGSAQPHKGEQHVGRLDRAHEELCRDEHA